MTTFENKCVILSSIWIDYQDDVDFVDFILDHEIALTLANAIDERLMDTTPMTSDLIDAAFDALIAGFGLSDAGFEHMDDLMTAIQAQ
jgi:hypothetical protein